MSKPITDFTESQVWTIQECLKNGFRKNINIQLIEDELADCTISLLQAQADHLYNENHELEAA